MQSKKAVFLDKDGTLIPDIPFNVSVDLISLSAHAVKGLRVLQQMGYIFIVVTNQPGIARGYFSDLDVMEVGQKLKSLLQAEDIKLSGYYYCPHAPVWYKSWLGLGCSCRKPKPGLLKRAAKELDIDLSSSWMVGDILNDIEAGNAAGCRTILINNGNETEWEMTTERTPDMIAANINAAAAYIFEMGLQKLKYLRGIYSIPQ